MRTLWPLAVAIAFALSGVQVGLTRAQSSPPVRDLAKDVRDVFATKCAGCHGAELEKPEGRFGYVLDLRRLAANPELVISRHPDESEMWVLIERGEMPPSDSPQGALTPSEKETIREWIAAGASDSSPSASASASAVSFEQPYPTPRDVRVTVEQFESRASYQQLLNVVLVVTVTSGMCVAWRRRNGGRL